MININDWMRAEKESKLKAEKHRSGGSDLVNPAHIISAATQLLSYFYSLCFREKLQILPSVALLLNDVIRQVKA